jgi:hypothetical protein
MPVIVKVPLVPAASAHVPPLSPSVTTTVALKPRLERLQLLKPAVGVIVGATGTVVPAGRATVIVSPAASAPVVPGGPATVADGVSEAVYVTLVAAAARVEAVTVAALGVVWAAVVTADPELAVVESDSVLTVNPAAA